MKVLGQEEVDNILQYFGPLDEDCPEGYKPLNAVLLEAFNRAARGKGRERHATDEPFTQQPIFHITKSLGGRPDPLLFQAVKKIYESQRLENEPACNELLDAIVYLAAAVLLRKGVA